MPLYASISDLTIDLAWVQSLKSVDYNAWCGNLGKAPFPIGVGGTPSFKLQPCRNRRQKPPSSSPCCFSKLSDFQREANGPTKLDGYRALAIKAGGKVHLRSRNDNDFNLRYPAVVQALGALPEETVIDGEVVALDESGRPSFNTLQNYGSAKAPVFYYVFDVLVHGGRNEMSEPLSVRRKLLRQRVLPKLGEPIRHSPELNAGLPHLIDSVRAQGLEGLVAKRLDSPYEPVSGPAHGRRCASRRAAKFEFRGGTWRSQAQRADERGGDVDDQ
jgi:hypothetical protein